MADYELTNLKFGPPQAGTPGGIVTWSLAQLPGNLYAFDAVIGATFQQLIRDAFQVWESIANIDFVEVVDSAYNDIRLGWDAIDGTNGTLAEAGTSYFPSSNEFDAINFVEIRFDTAEFWTGAKDSPATANFFSTALHEIGHALGLAHTDDAQTVMFPYANGIVEVTTGDVAGARAIYGTAQNGGNDVVNGTNGLDQYYVGGGNDTVRAGDGNDTVWGESGSDLLEGGMGRDRVYGNEDNDQIFGNQGEDRLFGGQGADILYGGQQSDEIYGNLDNDALFGNLDDDYLHGGQGDDFLHGGQGNDFLVGGLGNDTLHGGLGADRFVFNQGGGNDQVQGFNYAEGDRLDLGGQSYSAASIGGNLMLTLGDGGTITLLGIDQSSSLF